jgi:hypothetical protein
MKNSSLSPVLLLLVGLAGKAARATELTFELTQHDRQCFYDEIEEGQLSTLEYQVSRSNLVGAKSSSLSATMVRPMQTSNNIPLYAPLVGVHIT